MSAATLSLGPRLWPLSLSLSLSLSWSLVSWLFLFYLLFPFKRLRALVHRYIGVPQLIDINENRNITAVAACIYLLFLIGSQT
jgi:hypothetical protein